MAKPHIFVGTYPEPGSAITVQIRLACGPRRRYTHAVIPCAASGAVPAYGDTTFYETLAQAQHTLQPGWILIAVHERPRTDTPERERQHYGHQA